MSVAALTAATPTPSTGPTHMSYVDDHLLPNEAVTYRTTPHWKVYVWPVTFSALVWRSVEWCWRFAASYREPLGGRASVRGRGGLVTAFVKRSSAEYAVTNKRVIAKVGVM